MNCETAFDEYCKLDKNQIVPLKVFFHLLSCPVCRTAVRSISKAEKLMAKPLKTKKNINFDKTIDPTVLTAIERIKASGYEYPNIETINNAVSMGPWVFSGLILICGFISLPFTHLGKWAVVTFGLAFSLPFSIVGGLALTIYCGMFVASNIDFFVKKFGFR